MSSKMGGKHSSNVILESNVDDLISIFHKWFITIRYKLFDVTMSYAAYHFSFVHSIEMSFLIPSKQYTV